MARSPKEKRGDLHLRIPADLFRLIKESSKESRRSMTAEILHLLETQLKKNGATKP